MNWYSFVSRYYAAKYYSNEDVRVFVQAGKITPAQYETITGEPYATAVAPAPEPAPEPTPEPAPAV